MCDKDLVGLTTRILSFLSKYSFALAETEERMKKQ